MLEKGRQPEHRKWRDKQVPPEEPEIRPCLQQGPCMQGRCMLPWSSYPPVPTPGGHRGQASGDPPTPPTHASLLLHFVS